jgi:ABC-2 type transport system ATP-binding protein
MRKNHYELDLEGDQKSITKAVQTIKTLNEFKTVALKQKKLEIYLNDDVVASTALANLFMTLTDSKINLLSIKSIGQQTEEAFLDLVEQEESRGFARIYKQDAA